MRRGDLAHAPPLLPLDRTDWSNEEGVLTVERIYGTQALAIDRAALAERLPIFREVLIDLGTGDGRYVRRIAQVEPTGLAIGIDLCRENLRAVSRRAPTNALYLIADALALPPDLAGLATRIAINFPWGSLLRGLLCADAELYDGLRSIASPGGATRDLNLNGRALAVAGWSLEEGTRRVRANLQRAGWTLEQSAPLDRAALRGCATSWAKRLADGEDARAILLRARRVGVG